jgi:hypothetical protein
MEQGKDTGREKKCYMSHGKNEMEREGKVEEEVEDGPKKIRHSTDTLYSTLDTRLNSELRANEPMNGKVCITLYSSMLMLMLTAMARNDRQVGNTANKIPVQS